MECSKLGKCGSTGNLRIVHPSLLSISKRIFQTVLSIMHDHHKNLCRAKTCTNV